MKKYVCVNHCQMNIDGQITLCEKGGVYPLDPEQAEDHECFMELGAKPVDYVNASEGELRASEIDTKAANKVMKENFGVGLNGNKDPVEQILDIRFRNDQKTADQKLLAKAKAQKAEQDRIDKVAKDMSKRAQKEHKKNSVNLAKVLKQQEKAKAKAKKDAKATSKEKEEV